MIPRIQHILMQADGVLTGRRRRIGSGKIQQDMPDFPGQLAVAGQLRGPRQRHQKIHPVDPAAFFDGAPPFEFQKIDLLQRTEIIQRAVFRNRFRDPAVIYRADDLLLDETAAAVKRIQLKKVIALQQFRGHRRTKVFKSVHHIRIPGWKLSFQIADTGFRRPAATFFTARAISWAS